MIARTTEYTEQRTELSGRLYHPSRGRRKPASEFVSLMTALEIRGYGRARARRDATLLVPGTFWKLWFRGQLPWLEAFAARTVEGLALQTGALRNFQLGLRHCGQLRLKHDFDTALLFTREHAVRFIGVGQWQFVRDDE